MGKSLAGAGPFAGLSIAELARRLRSGTTTARALTESALTAAEALNPKLNCYVTIDHDGALLAADQADRELSRGVDRGPLHGIPVGAKDLIDTAGLRTTRGSRHFDRHVPTVDAAVVVALRQAGAVIVGKTHTHQFAYGPTGDIAHTGPARNPHDPTRMAGGSSSGSGAAVAAGLVPAALGTDTGGSVRIPAALCGVVGLRPTQGAVSMDGVFPLSPSLDTVGPLAATVADAAVVWSALAGRQMESVPAPVAGLQVGVVRSDVVDRVVPTQAAALKRACAELAATGFVLRDVPVPEMEDWARRYVEILGPEARALHADRVRNAPSDFDPEVLARLTSAAEVPGWHYVAAQEIRAGVLGAYPDRLGVDLLVLPTVPIEAPMVGARDVDLGAGWTNPAAALLAFNSPWSLLGLPAISIPVPAPDAALPGSIQLVARSGAEAQLLAVAELLAAQLD